MKNILYSLLAIILFSNFTFAQTEILTDEQHREMMNTFSGNLNNILTANCPVGLTIDQYKRGIINGLYVLPGSAQTALYSFATNLRTYGHTFADRRSLPHENYNYAYFYAAFPPSTAVENGKLIETTSGLTAEDMWSCALETSCQDCGSSVLVSDKNDMNIVATNTINQLTKNASWGYGVLIMVNEFSLCTSRNGISPEKFNFIGENHNIILSKFYDILINPNVQSEDLGINAYNLITNETHNLIKTPEEQIFVENEINDTFSNFIYYDSTISLNNFVLSTGALQVPSSMEYYFNNLEEILDNSVRVTNQEDTFSLIHNLEQRALKDFNITNRDLTLFYIATSVGKRSFEYWNRNYYNWDTAFSARTGYAKQLPGQGAVNKVGKADLKAGVSAAVNCLPLLIVPAEGELAYAAAVIGKAGGSSLWTAGKEIGKALWDSWNKFN